MTRTLTNRRSTNDACATALALKGLKGLAPLWANKGSISIAGGAAAKGGGTNGAFQKFRPGSLNGVEPNHTGT